MATWITRADAGLKPPKWNYTYSNGADGVVIHHLGGGAFAGREPKALWREVQSWHQDGRGWNDVAYSLAVAPGVILEGRSTTSNPKVRTAATGNANPTTFAVCALVGTADGPPSDELLSTLGEAVAWLRAKAGAASRVSGHRDWMSTDCPGLVYPHLATIKSRADGPPPAPPAPKPPAPKPSPRMPMKMPYGWDRVEGTLGRGCVFAADLGTNRLRSWSGVWNGSTPGGAKARPFIADLQRGMVSRGYALRIDGVYGPQSQSAVHYAQRNVFGMGSRGPVGPKTWHAIFNTPIKP